MLITAICILLLGTKLGEATTKTEVKYEGADKITVVEQKDDAIIIPGLGSPPFAPAFLHQGSNFFFNPQIVMPEGILPMGLMVEEKRKKPETVEVIIPEVIMPEVIKVEEPVPLCELPVVPELPTLVVPEIQVEEVVVEPAVEVEINRIPIEIPIAPELPQLVLPELPLPNPPVPVIVEQPCEKIDILVPEAPILIEKIETEIPMAPLLPELVLPELPLPNPPVQVLVEECDEIEISNNIIPEIPMLIEEPCEPSNGLYISEVNNVILDKIPPPPELPPLIITEIPQPVVVENKNIILVPAAPEIKPFYPPSIMITEKVPMMPIDCAQNIIFERVLPNLAVKNGQIVELISIPAKKRAPVVTTLWL